MKKLLLILFCLLLSFSLGLVLRKDKGQVKAAETKTCKFILDAEFDSNNSKDKSAVVKNKSGYLLAQFQGISINCNDYNGSLNWGAGWQNDYDGFCVGSPAEIGVQSVSFGSAQNYPLAAYLTPKPGKTGPSYYCGNGQALVYEETGIQTEGGWINKDQTAQSPNIYTSPSIRPTGSGKVIGGLKYKVDYFEPDLFLGDCTTGSPNCYYQILPSSYRDTGEGVWRERAFIFREGQEPDEIYFSLVPDRRAGCEGICSVAGQVGSNSNIILYTRPPNLPTPTQPPIPESCSSVYGYVRTPDEDGIQGASVKADKVDSGACIGGHSGCGTATTNSSGYWSISCSGDMECLYVEETANATGYNDSSQSPTGPSGSSAWSINSIVWSSPPTGSCGPFTFYDEEEPAVTCTSATLSPASATIDQGDDYTLMVIDLEGDATLDDISSVDYEVDPSNIASLGVGSTASGFPIEVTGDNVGEADITATVNLTGGGSCQGTSEVTVGAVGPWFQTINGDVHARGNLYSDIPSTATDRNFSVGEGVGGEGAGTWGVVSYDEGASVDFGAGYSSADDSTHWLAESSASHEYNFGWFYQTLDQPSENFDSSIPDSDPNGDDLEIYYSSGTIPVDGGWNIASGRKVIILIGEAGVQKNVNLQANITINSGGFLMLVSSGHININEDITELHGVYFADGHISVAEGDTQFQGEGMFHSNEPFVLDRDLGALNQTTPAETFTYRIDLMMNSPHELWQQNYTWEELAP